MYKANNMCDCTLLMECFELENTTALKLKKMYGIKNSMKNRYK